MGVYSLRPSDQTRINQPPKENRLRQFHFNLKQNYNGNTTHQANFHHRLFATTGPPARIQGIHYWYCSPLCKERTPSFKINTERNQWYDFGSGEHGDIIDLVCALFRCSISEAVGLLSGAKQVAHQEFSFGGERKISDVNWKFYLRNRSPIQICSATS